MNRASRRRVASERRAQPKPSTPDGLVAIHLNFPTSPPWVRDDRDWFAAHPRRSHRVRLPFPGETFDRRPGEAATAPNFVVIQQICPGQRARRPFTVATCADDTVEIMTALIQRGFEQEGAAHVLFDIPGDRLVLPHELKALIAAYEATSNGVN